MKYLLIMWKIVYLEVIFSHISDIIWSAVKSKDFWSLHKVARNVSVFLGWVYAS